MKLRFARSATRHRISKDSIRFVIETSGMWITVPPPADSVDQTDDRVVFLGDDPSGRALEIMAIELLDDELLVIHAMKLRPRFRNDYLELRKWQS